MGGRMMQQQPFTIRLVFLSPFIRFMPHSSVIRNISITQTIIYHWAGFYYRFNFFPLNWHDPYSGMKAQIESRTLPLRDGLTLERVHVCAYASLDVCSCFRMQLTSSAKNHFPFLSVFLLDASRPRPEGTNCKASAVCLSATSKNPLRTDGVLRAHAHLSVLNDGRVITRERKGAWQLWMMRKWAKRQLTWKSEQVK